MKLEDLKVGISYNHPMEKLPISSEAEHHSFAFDDQHSATIANPFSEP